MQIHHSQILRKSSWSVGGEELLRGGLRDAVGERESEIFGEELFDVRPLDVGSLLDFNDFEDLVESAGRLPCQKKK